MELSDILLLTSKMCTNSCWWCGWTYCCIYLEANGDAWWRNVLWSKILFRSRTISHHSVMRFNIGKRTDVKWENEIHKLYKLYKQLKIANITKSTTDPRVEFSLPNWSYHKFKHKSWSNFNFRISIKHWHQNLKQTSVSRQILIKPSFSQDSIL